MKVKTSLYFLLCLLFSLSSYSQIVYSVNTLDDSDDGVCDAIHCSLREAINAANTDLRSSRIEFRIGPMTQRTIRLDDALPIIEEDSTVIDGTTQTGVPGGLRINCQNIGAQTQDIIRIHGDYTEIYGLEIYNYTISEDAMVTGAGSLIGVGGIFVLASPTTVQIGAPGKGNILHSTFRARATAANYGNGIAVHSGTEIIIQSNRIGTNYAANMPLELYGEGIRIDENNFGETIIGGTAADEANIIGSALNGIGIYGGDGTVVGNFIGVSPDLSVDLGNRSDGVVIRDGDFYDIGDSNPLGGNIIWNNANGINIVSNNSTQYVGNNDCGFNSGFGIFSTACPDCLFEFNACHNNRQGMNIVDNGNTRILVRYNEFFENQGSGVEVEFDMNSRDIPITQNSHYCNGFGGIVINPRDGDPFTPFGFNNITATQIIGIATPNSTIEIFERDTTGCPDVLCDGKYYLGSTTSDAAGLWIYNDAFIPGGLYSATQTIPRKLTSPFACFEIPECTTVVTTPADNGSGTLREAIHCANSTPGPDTITFNIPGGIPRVINLLTPLPSLIDDATVIDATTQFNNFPMNNQITINCGSLSGLGTTGLRVEGDHCEIYGLVITDSEGAAVIAGRDLDPINHFVLGAPEKYNVFTEVAFWGANIFAGLDVTVQSNYFGSDQSYSPPINTTNVGCLVQTKDTSSQIVIGGSKAANEGNFFVFCDNSGLEIAGQGVGSMPTRVLGNYFGTDAAELVTAGNGINANNTGAITLSNNRTMIGDGTDDHQNIIAFSASPGIFATLGDHTFQNNSFYCNEEGGIDLNSNNQMGNNAKPAPIILQATTTAISGTCDLQSTSIEVYRHGDDRCPDVPCQGKTVLGVANAVGGNWVLNAPYNVMVSEGELVTALATGNNQTSEFANCVEICPELDIMVSNTGPYCEGDSVFLTSTITPLTGNVTYTWSGPNAFSSNDPNPTGLLDSGLYVLTVEVEDCEYPVHQTRVTILGVSTKNIDTTICAGSFITVGGEIFDESRPDGQVILTNRAGCDSVIDVRIEFEDEIFELINETLCEDDFIIINGKRYDESNPNGNDTIVTSQGCDSILIIELNFTKPTETMVEPQVCRGQSVTINGIVYNESNPRGMDTITASNGCDSILIINLQFIDAVENDISRELCFGDSLIVNGIIYNENNPSGTDTLMSSAGCDSIIRVSLNFGSARVETIDTSICPGEFIVINGEIYDSENRSGSDTIPMGSSNGCDSVINVNISLSSASVYTLDTILCPKGSITVNGIVYDQFYMEGTDTIFGGSSRGCDSVINVRISYPNPEFDIDTVSPNCDGSQLGQFIINGISDIPEPFMYSLNGSPFRDILQFPWTIDALDAGKYDLIFIDGKDCRHLIQLDLVQTGNIDFNVTSPITIEQGDSTSLTFNAPFNPDSIIWTDQNGMVICRNCPDIIVSPQTTSTYNVTLFRDSCFSSKSIIVEVIPFTEVINFYVPNVFSPDGDNINDFFNVFSNIEGVIVEQLDVFDRWGELIYRGMNLDASKSNQGWNGTYRDKQVNPGVYVYHFKVLLPSGQRENLSGSVTIVR